MDYHGNHYFTDIKISDFATGRPCYFRQIMHIFSTLYKWVGYFDPSL